MLTQDTGCFILLSMFLKVKIQYWQEIETPNNDKDTTQGTITQMNTTRILLNAQELRLGVENVVTPYMFCVVVPYM